MENANEKEKELNKVIQSLSDIQFNKDNPSEKIEIQWKKLFDICQGEYRYHYSYITRIIYQIKEADITSGEKIYKLQFNFENIRTITERELKNYANDNLNGSLKEQCEKILELCDHINLEIARIDYSDKIFKETYVYSVLEKLKNLKKYSDVKKELLSLECSVEESKNNYSTLRKDFDGVQRGTYQAKHMLDSANEKIGEVNEIIANNMNSSLTVLTIFSAIILTFSSGFTWVINESNKLSVSSHYRIILIICIIGFVIFNTIFVLLFAISRMTGKRISCQCTYAVDFIIKDNSVQESEKPCENKLPICGSSYCYRSMHQPDVICNVLHKYPYVFAINFILMYFMYLDILICIFNYPENFIIFKFFTKNTFNLYWISCIPFAIFLIIIGIEKITQAIQHYYCGIKLLYNDIKNMPSTVTISWEELLNGTPQEKKFPILKRGRQYNIGQING